MIYNVSLHIKFSVNKNYFVVAYLSDKFGYVGK